MKRIPTLISAAALIAAGGLAATAADDDVTLEFPADYKSTYTNYMAADRLNGKQFISLYANDVAYAGARADGKLPYGSVLVGELYPAVADADGEPLESALGHLIHEDAPSALVVMQRIEGNDAKWGDDLKVGDWAFEVFSPTGENLGKDTTACRECHTPLDSTEYMFSYEHLAMKLAE